MTSPLDPAAAETVRAIFAESERALFERIARRLARGIDEPGWADAKLADVIRVRLDFERQVAEASSAAAREVGAQVVGAYTREASDAVREVRAAGQRELRGAFGRGGNPAAMRALAQEANGRIASIHPRMLRAATDIYRSTVIDAAGAVLSGAQTRRDAAQTVLNRYADRGISGFTDAAGRQWDAASYAEMTTRTSVNQAARAGHVQTLADEGFDLVIVSTSPARCPLCDPWEGRVLSISGNSKRFPKLTDAQAAGLFHPNCTHRTGLYVQGLTRPAQERPPKRERDEEFADSQAQRYNERQIRAWKRREAVALTSLARAESRAKVRAWQSRQRAHVEATGRPRLYRREQITRAR